MSATQDEGWPAFVKRLVAAGLVAPGNDRAARLLRLGRDPLTWLEENSAYVCYDEPLPRSDCLPA